MEEQIFAARELQKGDDRPGGYLATGGHGGIIGSMGKPGPPVLTFRPARLHTHRSHVRLSLLPPAAEGVQSLPDGRAQRVPVEVVDRSGGLLPSAIPKVTVVKHARYLSEGADVVAEVEVLARVNENLGRHPLAGFVAEGGTPYGHMGPSTDAALRRATCLGMPVVKVSRGNADGIVPAERMRMAIAGNNLTATKARLLLMACLLRFGSLPLAADPDHPTPDEVAEIEANLRQYQSVFDSH
jgi:hypothetical protein